MRISPLAPLVLLTPLASASLAADAFSVAASLVSSSSGEAQQAAALLSSGDSDKVHIFNAWSYVDCGAATDAVQLKSISVSPDPPVPGENLTVTVEADVIETIDEGAEADVTVKLGLVKLLQKTFDVCEEARNANATVQCPVAPGSYKVSQTVELPKEIPRAKFAVQVRGFTAEELDMLCLDLFVDFMKKPGTA